MAKTKPLPNVCWVLVAACDIRGDRKGRTTSCAENNNDLMAKKPPSFPERLERVRLKTGLNNSEFLVALGISEVRYYELKKLANPSWAHRVAILALEKFGIDWLKEK